MKKKILIALMALLLPAFIVINSLADNHEEDDDITVEVNNNIMINSPLFTKKESTVQYSQPAVDMVTDGFEFVTKKGDLSLYTNPKNGAVRVQNDITKFVWASDILGISEYRLNKSRTSQLQSPFEMAYRDEGNNPKTVYSTSNNVDISLVKNEDGLTYLVDVSVDDSQVDGHIKFEYNVVLSSKGIDVTIPHEKIEEIGSSLLTTIKIFPYFGSTFGDSVPGYIFVPSGNGGLIRFDSNPAINAIYSRPYYGTDANRTKVSTNEEENGLSLPIYGITQGVGKNAVLASITSGSAFASFNYEPSSINQVEKLDGSATNGFHKVYNTFNFRETYTISFGSNQIFMKPEEIYKQDASIKYTFLDDNDANYVGMAHEYQKQLVNKGVLHRNSNSGSGNVHFDILGGETENGIVFDKFIKMTTTDQLKLINDELTKKFTNKFIYTLRGFYKDGYSRQTVSNVNFDSRLGSMKDLDGLDYYMYYNPVESYGTSSNPDNTSLVNIYNEKYFLTVEEGKKYKYYTNVDNVLSGLEKAISKYPKSIAIDGMYHLYGDHNAEYTRSDVMNKFNQAVADEAPIFKPNEYMLSGTSHYLNMPLYHDRTRFITDSVPFLQIALRGYIDYYSTYLNFSTNQNIDLLKCIEYGSNLAYLVSYEESYLIANTLSNHLYATHYESNKKQIFSQINDATIALNQVKGEFIDSRNVIENGVVEVTYSNGVKIYVNYTSDVYDYSGIEIPSMGYWVVS